MMHGAMAVPAEDAGLRQEVEVTSSDEESPIHRIDLLGVSDEDAAQALADFRRLVIQLAKNLHPKKHVVYWIDFEDLVAVGNAAIMEALASFDASKGVKKVTWVGHIVKRRMLEACRRARGFSRTAQATATRLHFVEQGKLDKHGQPYEPPTPEKVEELASARRFQGSSLQAPLYGEEALPTMLDRVEDVTETKTVWDEIEIEDVLTRKARVVWLRTAIRRILTPGERQAVLSFLQDESSPEAAMRMGISRQRLAQLRDNAFKKLALAARKMGWSEFPQLTLIFHHDED